MKITGQATHTKETNQEKFMGGGNFLGAGEFTVKVVDVEFNDKENRYFTIVLENEENKQLKHNVFIPPFNQDWQEKQYIQLLSRLGIKLDLPDLTFDTNDLKNKAATAVIKRKWNDDEGKFFTRLSYFKTWEKGDEVVNKPEPLTEDEKAKLNGNSQPTNKDSNPFANANGPIDISDDDLPF